MTTNPTPQPFQIKITDAELDDLQRRLEATRWADPAPDPRTDFARGVPLPYLKELTEYWRQGFDWRAQEARLNQIPQFTAEIDGQPIHYLHVRSPEPQALPLLIIHGYPSSVVESVDLIGPLSDPRSHGGDPEDAFDLVIPSLPGFGFSNPVRQPGWELGRTTAAFAELMARLGYARYGAHGGDIGAGVSGRLGATGAGRMCVGRGRDNLDHALRLGIIDRAYTRDEGWTAELADAALVLLATPVGEEQPMPRTWSARSW